MKFTFKHSPNNACWLDALVELLFFVRDTQHHWRGGERRGEEEGWQALRSNPVITASDRAEEQERDDDDVDVVVVDDDDGDGDGDADVAQFVMEGRRRERERREEVRSKQEQCWQVHHAMMDSMLLCPG